MLDIRRRDEADGDKRMIGSTRRLAALSLVVSVAVFTGAAAGPPGFFLSLVNNSVYFLRYEKS